MTTQLALPAKITRASVQVFINRLRSNPDYRRTNYLDHVARDPRPVPSPNDIGYRRAIESQGPRMTVNDDGSFSAPALTRWYVTKFCDLNNLTGAGA